ncbi:MAG: hypothetical protein U1E39_06475 [Planctomycetota bacterium]
MSTRAFIYFHRSCFDGVVSAALCGEVLSRRWGAKRFAYRAVGYEMRDVWLNTRLPARSAVVDFLFHPSAEFWADHHPTTFLPPLSQLSIASPSPDGKWIYDPSAPSCASVLRSELCKLAEGRAAWYADTVAWCDKIDSAAYESAEEAVLSDAPAIQISRALAAETSRSRIRRVIQQLAIVGLPEIARTPWIRATWQMLAARGARALGLFRQACRVLDGVVAFEVSGVATYASRYAPFYFFPSADYSVGLVNHGSYSKVTAMRNPWKNFPSAHIGEIFTQWGGGGHERVGSAIFQSKNLGCAREALDDVVRRLRVSPSSSRALAQ